MMKQDPGGHTDRGTVDRQASETANYWENTKCPTEETEASKLLQEHSLPYSRPSLLLLVWEVLFNDFHKNIMATHTSLLAIPVQKVKPSSTTLVSPVTCSYRSSFLSLHVDQNPI